MLERAPARRQPASWCRHARRSPEPRRPRQPWARRSRCSVSRQDPRSARRSCSRRPSPGQSPSASGHTPTIRCSPPGLALILGTVLVLGALIVRISGAPPFRNTARFAVIASAAALLVKLLVLLHPDMPVGDALFHAHRFQQVLDGNLYFTSIAPGNYLFPYAPGLYVLASGVARLVPLRYRGHGAAARHRCRGAMPRPGRCSTRPSSAGAATGSQRACAVALYHAEPADVWRSRGRQLDERVRAGALGCRARHDVRDAAARAPRAA